MLLWVDKYRPSTVRDCILPIGVKAKAQGMIDSGNMTNLILSGSAGTGKTTLALAIANETKCETKIYNGSDGSLNIDELRGGIAEFAATESLFDDKPFKMIIIDEADGLSSAIQGALRHAIEKYQTTCRFILTCNYPDKIIQALHSRCARIDYKFDPTEMNSLLRQFAGRCVNILSEEGIKFEIDALAHTCKRYFPDNRRILNELQSYANRNGIIDMGITDDITSNESDLFSAINSQDFMAVKTWAANNTLGSVFVMMYSRCEEYIPADKLPLFIHTIGTWQKAHGSVASDELNFVGCIVEYFSSQ